MSRPTVSLTTLVDRLRSTEGSPITSDLFANLLSEVHVDEATLRPHVGFRDDRYCRHLVHRDTRFEIMLLCWKPGQGTPIHTHNGQLGWAFAARGALDCQEYAWRGCDRPENQNVSGLDCLAGGREVNLEPIDLARCTPGGAVSRVTKQVTIHSLTVPDECTEPVVSLHVYSLPFDSCVVFDRARGGCERKQLAFDSAPAGYTVPLQPDAIPPSA